MFGSQELIIIGLIIFVLFGASAIPKFAKSLGQAKKEFEKGVKEVKAESEDDSKKES